MPQHYGYSSYKNVWFTKYEQKTGILDFVKVDQITKKTIVPAFLNTVIQGYPMPGNKKGLIME